jgi:hypothetical protein
VSSWLYWEGIHVHLSKGNNTYLERIYTMEFEEWITKWCDCDEFCETEEHFDNLAREGLNGPDDMLDQMEQAFEAGVESTKGYTMTTYKAGDYVLVELSPNESYVVTVIEVHDGHYDVLEYSAGELVGELYEGEGNHRLIGR